jgi:hypothetical protein
MSGEPSGSERRVELAAAGRAGAASGSNVFLGPVLQGWDFSYISYRATPALVTVPVAVYLSLLASYIRRPRVRAGRRIAL